MNIPTGWRLDVVGGALAGTQYGTSVPSSGSGTRPIVGMRNLVNGIVSLSNLACVDEEAQDWSTLTLRRGDILLNRTNSPDLVGKIGIVREQTNAVFASYLVRLEPDLDQVAPEYLACWLGSPMIQGRIRKLATRGVSQANVNPSTLRQHCPVLLPPLPEQRKIAEILRTWDDAIDKALELRKLADTRRAELAERILAPSHGTRRKLSELTRPIKTRNSAAVLGRDSVMGVSNRSGLVPMREQTIAADISRYQILPPRTFAYNPMRINVGSIAMSRLESDVLVSPDYVLFQCDERELRPEYLDHVLTTRWWLHHVNAGASGSVRTRTYYDDLAAISIAAPPIAEQDNVSRALDGLSKEIDLLQCKAELLRTQKRGLMQKLLSGQVRVNVAADIDPGGQDDD